MLKRDKNKLTKIVFIISGGLLILGGLGFLGEGKTFFGIIQLLAGILNLGMLMKFIKGKTKSKLELAVLFMNIIVYLTVAIDYIMANRSYLQYAWILAAIFSAFALVLHIKKGKVSPVNSPGG